MTPDILLGEDRWLFIRQMTFKKAGDREAAHHHQYDHHTVLFKGRAQFRIKGKLLEYAAPAIIFIESYEVHEIIALEDDTQAACVHYLGALRAGER